MFVYRHGSCNTLDLSDAPVYDHLVDIRANYERLFSYQPHWVHFPLRLIVESASLPEYIAHDQILYIFNGCPHGSATRRAVDLLWKKGYTNCFTLTNVSS